MRIRKLITATVFGLAIFIFSAGPVLAAESYTVKAGDTLYRIATKYGISVAELQKQNGLKDTWIYADQVLRIPEGKNITASRSAGFLNSEDIYWLSKAVYAEARGESYAGQVAVAAVILNRLENEDFPKTVKGVIFEPTAFTCVSDGQIYLDPSTQAVTAAREALMGSDPTGGALYYWNPKTSTSKWVWSRHIIKRIGNHVFAV